MAAAVVLPFSGEWLKHTAYSRHEDTMDRTFQTATTANEPHKSAIALR